MGTISDQTIREVHERIDIVEFIGKYVALSPAGRQFKGLCPFHREKSPSFFVDPIRKAYKCFGCGVWGDSIEFVSQIEGKGFVESLATVAQAAGVSLPNQRQSNNATTFNERDQAFAITASAAQYYRERLQHDSTAASGREYQKSRNIDEEQAERFRVGYAPAPSEAGWDGLSRHLSEEGHSLAMAQTLGLLSQSERTGSYYDRLRGRLIFPIVLPGGSIVGFSGRILPEFAKDSQGEKVAKYLNSPESILFHKNKILFGLHLANRSMREKKRAILVEGNLDVVTLHRLGFEETIAPLGTALGREQCELISRFSDTVVLCFDGDKAGMRASWSALSPLLEAGLDVQIASLPSDVDPDDCPPDRLQALLERPGSAIEWAIIQLASRGAAESVESRARALRAILPLLRRVRATDIRGDYALMAADLFKLPPQRVLAALQNSHRAESQRRGSNRSSKESSLPNSSFSNQTPEDEQRQLRATTQDRPDLHSRTQQSSTPQSRTAQSRLAKLSSAQCQLLALLIDHPELAGLAESSNLHKYIDHPDLLTILNKLLELQSDGAKRLCEGALLELTTPENHRDLHQQLFLGNYLEIEDPSLAFAEALRFCDREKIDAEILAIDAETAAARQSGDVERVRELAQLKIGLRNRQRELRLSQSAV